MFYQSKEIRRKMIAIVSCVMAFFTFAYATPFVSAFSDEQTYDGQRIPDYMQPSSIIKYVTDKEYVILKGGEPDGPKYNETIEEQVAEDQPLLGYRGYPDPEEGMVVYYGMDGELNDIDFATKEAEEAFYSLTPEQQQILDAISNDDEAMESASASAEDSVSTNIAEFDSKKPYKEWGAYPNRLYKMADGSRKGTGRATIYGDKYGQYDPKNREDHKLVKGDVATKMTVDDCVCGTTVKVRMTKKDSKSKLTVKMKKWDVGSMPNAIIDIWKYGIENWGYTYTSARLDDWDHGGVTITHPWKARK